jgi:hypothetical protein
MGFHHNVKPSALITRNVIPKICLASEAPVGRQLSLPCKQPEQISTRL